MKGTQSAPVGHSPSPAISGTGPQNLQNKPTPEWIEQLRRKYPTERYVDQALSRKLNHRAGPPRTAQSFEQLEKRLHLFLSRRLDGDFELSDIRPLSGGSSKQQFRFRMRSKDPVHGAKNRDYVLRLEPLESVVETHRQREFDILKALWGRFPVPEVLWCDPEGEELGQPGLIMAFVEGLVRPPGDAGDVTSSSPKVEFNEHYRNLVGPRFLRLYADLHALDWASADIPSLDVPEEGTNQAVIWHINWLQRVWEEDHIEPMPLITSIAAWLRENAPVVDRLSILHGDLRSGNFLFDQDTGDILAMLDWELVHLGDRHEDIAYTLMPFFTRRDEKGDLRVTGLWKRDEFLAGYEQMSGMTIDPDRLRYYQIFQGWRCAIVSLGTAGRSLVEQNSHQDILLGWVVGTGYIALQQLLDAMAEVIQA
jgi:aminoglycoside phosphotransferase (APT) family kinase protein